jgi:hypothetical protein
VQRRDGSSPRCEDYCKVRQFCQFGRSLK